MKSDRFVLCPGSGAMGIEANRVPASAGSKRLTDERGLCPLCDRYYTTDRGIAAGTRLHEAEAEAGVRRPTGDDRAVRSS